jgi:hypothetical protein
MPLAKRLDAVASSATLAMSARAAELKTAERTGSAIQSKCAYSTVCHAW